MAQQHGRCTDGTEDNPQQTEWEAAHAGLSVAGRRAGDHCTEQEGRRACACECQRNDIQVCRGLMLRDTLRLQMPQSSHAVRSRPREASGFHRCNRADGAGVKSLSDAASKSPKGIAADLGKYPGGDVVEQGLLDLKSYIRSDAALLVLIIEPRLRRLGFRVPAASEFELPYEHALFAAIESRNPIGAHAVYNALIAQMVNFVNAYTLAYAQISMFTTPE